MKLGRFEIPGYYVGDARALLAELPDESVQCVVTSPPYWGLRDYGTGAWDGGDSACPHSFRPGGTAKSTLGNYDNGLTTETIEKKVTGYGHATYRNVCGKCGAHRVDRQLGLESTPEEYVAVMVEVFREVRRVLRSDGTLWLNLGDSYAQGNRGGIGDASTLEGGAVNQNESRKASRRRDNALIPDRRSFGVVGAGLKPKDLIGIPWRVAFALQADGWWLRSDIIWAKPNPMPESVTDRPTKSHEYLFLFAKSDSYYYDADAIRERMVAPESSTPADLARAFSRRRAAIPQPDQAAREPIGETPVGRNRRSVWTIPTQPTPDAHFATFPRKLVEPCILAGCPAGGVVLDPFGGSGTVGRVAEDHGRRWLLFDLSADYQEIAKRKTAQTGLLVRAAGGIA